MSCEIGYHGVTGGCGRRYQITQPPRTGQNEPHFLCRRAWKQGRHYLRMSFEHCLMGPGSAGWAEQRQDDIPAMLICGTWTCRWCDIARASRPIECNYFSLTAVRILITQKKGGRGLCSFVGWRLEGLEGITSVIFDFIRVCACCPRLDFPVQLDGVGIVSCARHEREQAVQPSYCSKASKPASQLAIRERQQCNFDFRYHLYVHIHGDVTGQLIRPLATGEDQGAVTSPTPRPPPRDGTLSQ